MKEFKITDVDGVNTCIYVIKDIKDTKSGKEYPFLKKIELKEEIKNQYRVKSFSLEENEEIILLSILKNKIVVNARWNKRG